MTFEFEIFTGGKNQKFDSFIKKYGLTNEKMLFVDFLQTDFAKKFYKVTKYLKFDGSYKSYFQWILNEFDAQQKTKYIFSLKNTKYLIYCFNDFQNSIGKPLIKIRHALVTDNYLAAEEIQNQGWEYFIERKIEVCNASQKKLVRQFNLTKNFYFQQ